MCNYLPDGFSDADIDAHMHDEGLAPNQQAEHDFYEKGVKKLKKLNEWLDNNRPDSLKNRDTINDIRDIFGHDYDINDYLSKPEQEDREK